MRSSVGWFKIWRLPDDHWMMSDPSALFLWWTLISMATYKPTKIKSGTETKELDVGTVVTSRGELALKTGLGEKATRLRLQLFENEQMIGQQKTSQGTIITICNWKKYQETDDDEGQQMASRGPAEGQPRASEGPLIKKERNKEEKKEENTISPEQVPAGDNIIPMNKTEKVEVQNNDQTDYQSFAAVWNENRGTLPACKKLSVARKKKIKCRLQEEPDLAYWVAAVRNLASSSFACSGNWCDIGWLIENDTNHVKASEGKYSDKQKQTAGLSPTMLKIMENRR